MSSFSKLAILFLILCAAVASTSARTLDVHVFGGPGTGNRVHIRVVDITGVVHVSKTIQVCTAYTFTVPDDLKFFIHIVDYDSWLPLYLGWERGPGDIDFEPPLPAVDGFCGDGVISGAETCDTKGNVGCDPTSSAPVCLAGCLACGCGSDEHCPHPTPPVGPCGYGRCAPTERPHWRRACIWGSCLFTYGCQPDPDCIAKVCEAEEQSQQSCADNCTDEDHQCYYGQSTGCWHCMTPGEVIDPCASPDQPDCLLDPLLIGIAVEEDVAEDTAGMSDELGIDGITEEETLLLTTGDGHFLGLVQLQFLSREFLQWRDDPAFDAWNVYRGSLDVLRLTGAYTQLPGSNPWALQYCSLPVPELFDVEQPLVPDDAIYYLVTTVSDGDENTLGVDPNGIERFHAFPCP